MNTKENVQEKRRWSLFPKPLASEVERIVKPVYHQHGFTEHRILTQWTEVVGRELAAGSAPKKLTFPKGKRDQGVLHVVVSSGARALELQHMQPVILERIATYFGYRAIEKILFQQDSSLHTGARTRKRGGVQTKPDAAFTNITTLCEDEALRSALLSLGSAISSKQQG